MKLSLAVSKPEETLGAMLASFDVDPRGTRTESFWPEVQGGLTALHRLWTAELQGQIFEPGIVELVSDIDKGYLESDLHRLTEGGHAAFLKTSRDLLGVMRTLKTRIRLALQLPAEES